MEKKIMKSAMTLDQANCRPRVLQRNFRSKTDAGIDLDPFPLDDVLPDSSRNFHLIRPSKLLTNELDPESSFVQEISSSSTRTFLSVDATNKSFIGP